MVEGTYFDSAFQTGSARLMTLDQYIGKVKSEEYARPVAYLRGLVKAGKKAEADACKKRLPLYVAGGVMEGGRRLEHMVRYSSCVVIDIDHSPIPVSELLVRAAALPYMKAGYGSPSGTGGKFFVLVDSGLQHHKPAFEVVRRRVEADLSGVEVDISGKDPNRGCFASHDPNAFYKEASEVIRIPIVEPVAMPSASLSAGGVPPGMRLSNYIDKYETTNPFVAGSRHSYLVKLASALNNAGFSPYDAISECIRRYSSADFPAAEVETTVADIFRRYSASHGSCAYRAGEVGPQRKTAKTAKTAPPFLKVETNEAGTSEDADIELDDKVLPGFDKEVYDHLPPLLTDILKRSDKRTERDVLLVSSLTLLGSVMASVRGSMREREYGTTLYTIVTGDSGSGKGCIAGLQRILEPWQQYIYDNSRHQVEEYEALLEEYENYMMRKRRDKSGKQSLGPAPSKPREVKQRNVALTGNVTQARLVELLAANSPYISCLVDTEMESVLSMFAQDYGKYSDILNKAFHHEPVGSSTKSTGSSWIRYPNLTVLLSGTLAMLPRLINSTESGLFSRILMYRIPGGGVYRLLTSADDTPAASEYYECLGQRVLDIGVFLDGSPTWVKFSDKQRKRLDRFFEREFYNVRSFGNEDMESTILRYRLIIFRLAMILTALRKAESGCTDYTWTVRDDDFETAFHIGKICLRHAYVVATSLQSASTEVHFKFPHHLRNLFASLPDSFKRIDLLREASVREISVSTVDKFLRKLLKNGLIDSEGSGYYSKTESGKQVVEI